MNTKLPAKAFIALLLISTVVSTVVSAPTASAHEEAETNIVTSGQVLSARPASREVTQVNSDFQNALAAYNQSSRNFKSAALANLVLIAKDRKAKMVQEAMDNPSGFLSSVLSSDTINQLPTEVRPLVEQQTTLTGKVIVLHVDSEDAAQNHYLYYLEDSVSHKKYQLNIVDGNLLEEANSIINATGTLLDNNLVMSRVDTNSSNSDVRVVKSVGILNTIGDQHTLAMRVKFSNVTNPTITYNDVENNIFTGAHSVNAYYKDSSSNLVSFSGDITPTLSIPFDNTNCLSRYYDWVDAADTAATAAGYNLSEYSRKIYYFEQAAGCGTEGGLGEVGSYPSRAWIFKSPIYDYPTFNFGIAVHEMGHNLGMNHANTIRCGSLAIDIYSKCAVQEYGDLYDVMGNDIVNFKTLNGAHRSMDGWLPGSQTQVVSSSGTFTIAPLETPGNSPRVLKILKPDDSTTQGDVYYYIEYRQPIGVDAALPSALVQGVSVIMSQTPNVAGTGRIDVTPGDFNFNNSALIDGGVFTDQLNNITIKQISHNSSGATVQVTMGNSPCMRSAPTISVNPTSQSIPAPTSYTSIYYTTTVINNDSAACPPSYFLAGAQKLPSGIMVSGSNKLLPPGGSGDLQLQLNFPNYTGSGLVNFLANVDDQNSVEGHYVTTPVSFTTPGGNCIRTAPTMSVIASSLTGAAGQPLAYNVSVTNNDSPTCPAVPNTTTLSALALPSGFTYNSTPLSLLPGATSNATITVTSPFNATDGTNNFSIKASNSSGAATKTVSYIVKNQSACIANTPSVNVSPVSQTTGAGQSANYTVSVTNTDTSSCNPSTFTVSASGLPAGFTSNTYTTTLAAGGTSFTTLTVTSPSNALNSNNNFNVNVVDSVNHVGHGGSASAAYIISNPCNRSAPEVSVTPNAQYGNPGQSENYTVIVANKDATQCGSSTFTVTANGLVAGYSSNTLSITANPGSFGSGTLTVTSPFNAIDSSAFNIVASDAAVPNHSGSTSATYYVQAVCNLIQPNFSVNVSPNNPIGTPGQTLNYTVTVTNNDAGSCNPSNIYFVTSLPNTLTGKDITDATIYPGQTITRTYAVTSQPYANTGEYIFRVWAYDKAGTRHFGTNTATYTVQSSSQTTITNPMTSRGAVKGDSTTIPSYSPDMIARVKELALYFFPNAIFPQ